jgi:hypothetical protein
MAKKSSKSRSKTTSKKTTFSMKEFVLYILVFALVGTFTLWVSFAAPHNGGGGKGGGGTISLVMVTDNNSDGLPNWGDTVTFNISTTATAQPYVHLVCSGNGVGYDSWRGFFVGSLDTNRNFILSSGGWTSGTADCTATLGMYTKHGFSQLASMSFHVNA